MEEYPSLGHCHIIFIVISVKGCKRTPPKGGFHTWHCETEVLMRFLSRNV